MVESNGGVASESSQKDIASSRETSKAGGYVESSRNNALLTDLLTLTIDGKPTVKSHRINLGDLEIWCERGDIHSLCGALFSDKRFDFKMFISVTAVDWVDSAKERYELVYHLLSLSKKLRIRLRVWVPEEDPTVKTVSDIWPGADFMEREVWDMYGVKFEGHSNLKRILMYDEFRGHPLRKDYPVQGKQPRIPLRAPEVRNTAVDMHRPELVAINKKRNTQPLESKN
jgi:NADH-quinone oxidoreductase subunit C